MTVLSVRSLGGACARGGERRHPPGWLFGSVGQGHGSGVEKGLLWNRATCAKCENIIDRGGPTF